MFFSKNTTCPSGQCHSTTTYGFENQWNWKFEMQCITLHIIHPFRPAIWLSPLFAGSAQSICLRVAARFMQCGKDYPPLCLHALFCLHTHDVLTNLVNCIFCRRPQKWWAARKELVASEQVKKSHGFWTLKVGFTRVLHIQANSHFLYTWALKCMSFDIHNRPPLTQYFDNAETALVGKLVTGYWVFWASKSRWAWPGKIRCQCKYIW